MDNRYQIWPLVKLGDGTYSLPDDLLISVWKDLMDNDRAKNLFYSGTVKNAEEFIEFLKRPSNSVYLVVDTIEKNLTYIGWLNGFFPPGCAWIHHCPLGKFRLKAAQAGIEWLANQTYPDGKDKLFWIFLGLTPSTNKSAVRMAEVMGFEVLGEIPYLCFLAYEEKIVPGILSYRNLRGEAHGRRAELRSTG